MIILNMLYILFSKFASVTARLGHATVSSTQCAAITYRDAKPRATSSSKYEPSEFGERSYSQKVYFIPPHISKGMQTS